MNIQDRSSVGDVASARNDEPVVVAFSGELDLSNAAGTRACLIDTGTLDAREVHVDLTQVTFLDSTTIGFLVSACKRVRAAGHSFSVIRESKQVRRTLEITGLLEYLDVRGTA